MIRVVVAEDSWLIRTALTALLDTQPDLVLAATVDTLPGLVEAVETHHPDVVVTDIRMPPEHGDEGIRAAEQLAGSHPDLGVVVLSQYVEPEWALRLFAPGARGRAYLLKERIGDLHQLRHAIDEVRAGRTVLDPQVVDALVQARTRHDNSPLARLTERETEVLGLVAHGLTNAAIAGRLSLGERSVEKHITSVLQKLELDAEDSGIHRRVRAVLVYLAASDGRPTSG